MPTPPTPAALFAPVFALAAWTFCILLLIAFRRLQAGFNGSVSPREYALGESGRVTAPVSLPNRNYMNLLELPLLFYVAVLLAHTTATATPLLVNLAWAYVALRIVHSLIHVTYNHVLHRFLAFAASNFVLLGIWSLLARAVLLA
ncbi:MAPEG family protein [Hydrogenophaga sp. MI9]|uniref:MAPEG family protein n=1 Tax=Hydrogenophaga sp. MI9 TaxID=3453719 RepID=UPI003EECFB69